MPDRPIPTEEDWGDYEFDPDQDYAHAVFFGKNHEQTMPYFERGVLERIDELRFMPIVPFHYYMLSLKAYVTSERVLRTEMASDAADGFLNLVIEKLSHAPDAIGPIMGELLPALEHVARNQALFNAKPEIYGSFQDKLAKIRGLYARNHGRGLSASD